jgi:hypothetical protein
VTDAGIELPVIDVTHPAFAFQISEGECSALIDAMDRLAQVPQAALQTAVQKSILIRGMVESAGTFTTGMMTYMNKLGPDNLGEGYASPIDRQWAASLTPVTFRWRMRDVIRLLANGLETAISARMATETGPKSPVHLLNIGGGPAMDSLNALIVTHKERPDLLAGRPIRIHVLDLDPEGPRFGEHALAALQAEGAPLHGLTISWESLEYNWSAPSTLSALVSKLEPDAVVVGSTEGGLFEYASDADIVQNLTVLNQGTPADMIMVGPVVRDPASSDPRLQHMGSVAGRPAIRFMGLAAFQKLADQAGWRIEKSLDGPMHQVVNLVKAR